MEDKILTLHPEGKAGVNISKDKYVTICGAITQALEAAGVLTFTELTEIIGQKIGDSFDGSIAWYVTTVKLDLEARGVIERIPKSSPQQLTLAGE